jgi:hypothetical protein
MTEPGGPFPVEDPVWRRLAVVLARREVGLASGSAVVDWATDALTEGRDSASLRVLAGLASSPNEFEVDDHVRAAAAELGVSLPERDRLLRLYATTVAEEIVTGRKRPVDGAKELYELFRRTNALTELGVWTGLDDAMSLATNGIYGNIADVEKEIIRHAHQMTEQAQQG